MIIAENISSLRWRQTSAVRDRIGFRCQLVAIATAVLFNAPALANASRPNFLVIVADDLGFSDIGAFGGEIDTPNIDALARSGVRFTGFHTTPTCSPTRAMLLSGTDNHRAGLGAMAGLIAPNQQGQPGHEGFLRPEVASLAELLADGGYRTLFSGKWHLGIEPEQDPHARGFQHSFALLQGGHNHFGVGTSSDPTKGSTYTQNGERLSGVPEDFYSSDYFGARLVDYIRETKAGPEGSKPFFAYLAFTAPHRPLQAPVETIAKYRGRYDAGFETLREERLKRQRELGLLDPSKPAHAPTYRRPWDSLSADEKRTAARDMEIYAAMVDRIDKAVGRVVDELKRTGEFENTVIVFLSDNGAEALDVTASDMVGLKRILDRSDNSFESRGSAASYVGYGPGWAQAGTAPSWLYKGYATEGGTRVVSFVSGGNFKAKGEIAGAFLSVADILPTFLELAEVPDHKGMFRGRPAEPIRGKSWVPYLTGRSDRVYGPNDAHGSELFGSRALRLGDWKITDIGDGRWRLFNIADDPGETNDLGTSEPERLAELVAAWDAYAKEVGVIMPNEVIYRP
ncbi:MAG: arylsulfatase [Sphingomonas sp.]|nr:MAG: arylsulfatase [Sphingomonas sp.]